mmetsp:Transcript_34812/g.58626  ORF Transcript_34812/g.58626 Transcript_34812/m.58626 type:complete len:239 (-) Transcript_34812:200-916(-)
MSTVVALRGVCSVRCLGCLLYGVLGSERRIPGHVRKVVANHLARAGHFLVDQVDARVGQELAHGPLVAVLVSAQVREIGLVDLGVLRHHLGNGHLVPDAARGLEHDGEPLAPLVVPELLNPHLLVLLRAAVEVEQRGLVGRVHVVPVCEEAHGHVKLLAVEQVVQVGVVRHGFQAVRLGEDEAGPEVGGAHGARAHGAEAGGVLQHVAHRPVEHVCFADHGHVVELSSSHLPLGAWVT